MRSESPGEAPTKATSSKALLAVMIVAFFCSGYQGDLGITESKQQHAILQASDVAKVPVILEGQVISNGVRIGHFRKSPVDGRPTQLWKARVRVENVLQGQVDESDVDIFYFLGAIPGSARSIRLRAGDRNIFFLRRDGARLRTNDDRSANSCLLPVKTGPHPNFRKASGSSINEAIISLLLTRGNGIDDKTMIAAIEQPEYSWFVGDDQVVKTLQHLAREETPLVKEAACTKLLFGRHACGQELDAPAVTIRNLTHPGSSGTFQLGDRIRTDLVGQAHQAVYRSGIGRVGVTDGNGHFTLMETTRNVSEGIRTDVWMIGAEELSPAVSYVAAGHGNQGWINTTVIGKPRE